MASSPSSEPGNPGAGTPGGAELLADRRRELAAARERVRMLADEVEWLEARGQLPLPVASRPPGASVQPRTPDEKVALFLELFGTRRDVFPKRWENAKTGKSGYSPACGNEWVEGVCRKPGVKCWVCAHQRFPPLDAAAVERHLRGLHAAGVYAISADSTCRFLAADFDGEAWREDVLAYRDAGRQVGVEIAVERSRSGNGAHGWIFFREPVPAALARRLGTTLLAKAAGRHPTLSLKAFDRLFPNQDVVPPGGWGNLIALPLARQPRQEGNSLFLDEELAPIPDQWAFLSGVPRLSLAEVSVIVGQIAPLPVVATEPRSDVSDLELHADECVLNLARPTVRSGMLSGEVTLRLDARLHVPRSLPAPVLAALRRLASMANPVFHDKLRLRFSTFDTPRFLFAGEWRPDRLVLPRGTAEPCVQIIEEAGGTAAIQDERETGRRCPWAFTGDLRPEQRAAVREKARHDTGILCAPPGAGKTVMGCALIGRHRTSALILVHRALLVEQWREAAMRFLGVNRKEIGVWRGSQPRLTRRLDIAMIPSVTRCADYAAAFAGYGLVLVDECHHVPAASFELLLKDCPARRIYGLTATPYRKDRLERLLYLQCGPIRHTIEAGVSDVDGRVVVVRHTGVVFDAGGPSPSGIHDVWERLVEDRGRLGLIVRDIASCLAEARSPLVLADRRSYLERIESALDEGEETRGVVRFRLDGTMGRKARAETRAKIDEHFRERRPFVLLATASLVGEGFDLPQLDTLLLTTPLSFKGRLIQYAGRLHRRHDEKASPRIYDYLDERNPLTQAMFRRRKVAYAQMGYRIEVAEPSRVDGVSAGLAALLPGMD